MPRVEALMALGVNAHTSAVRARGSDAPATRSAHACMGSAPDVDPPGRHASRLTREPVERSDAASSGAHSCESALRPRADNPELVFNIVRGSAFLRSASLAA